MMKFPDADQLASYQVGGFLHVPRYSASPRWLKILAEYYPGIVRRTALGSLIRFMYLPDYSDDWDANYFLSRVDPNYRPMPREELQRRYKAALKSLTLDDIVDSVSIPLYEHSLELISRDFPGTPIFAVFQPLWHSQEEYTRMTNCHSKQSQRPGSLCEYQVPELAARLGETRFLPGVARRFGSFVQ